MDGYNGTAVIAGGAATGGGLAATGMATVYWICAAFAVIAVGAALVRIAPRIRRRGNRR